MIKPAQRRSMKRPPARNNRILEGEAIHEFLAHRLPPGKTKQAEYLTEALLKAGRRYDRYSAGKNRKEWLDYASRRSRFEKIIKSVQQLTVSLSELDILSRDDLWSRIDPIAIEGLIGSLLLLSKETADLAKGIQKNGRPRDLAEERWILELADIYENAFGTPARVWKSEDGLMSDFYSLLELSRPEAFPRHGKLSRRQIARILRTNRRQRVAIDLFELKA